MRGRDFGCNCAGVGHPVRLACGSNRAVGGVSPKQPYGSWSSNPIAGSSPVAWGLVGIWRPEPFVASLAITFFPGQHLGYALGHFLEAKRDRFPDPTTSVRCWAPVVAVMLRSAAAINSLYTGHGRSTFSTRTWNSLDRRPVSSTSRKRTNLPSALATVRARRQERCVPSRAGTITFLVTKCTALGGAPEFRAKKH